MRTSVCSLTAATISRRVRMVDTVQLRCRTRQFKVLIWHSIPSSFRPIINVEPTNEKEPEQAVDRHAISPDESTRYQERSGLHPPPLRASSLFRNRCD